MRTTVRLDDELLEQLRIRAHREHVSITRLINRALRAGLRAGVGGRRAQAKYRERVHGMGEPRLSLDKALALAGALEDDGIVRELAARK